LTRPMSIDISVAPTSSHCPYTTLFRSEVQKTGSAKDVRFQWQKNNGSEWVPLTDASGHVGEYKVIAILDGDTNYTSASAEKTFRSEEHTSELQSRFDLVCRLLLEKDRG